MLGSVFWLGALGRERWTARGAPALARAKGVRRQGAAEHPWPARPSTRFAMPSCETWPTSRSPSGASARSIARWPSGSSRWDDPTITRRPRASLLDRLRLRAVDGREVAEPYASAQARAARGGRSRARAARFRRRCTLLSARASTSRRRPTRPRLVAARARTVAVPSPRAEARRSCSPRATGSPRDGRRWRARRKRSCYSPTSTRAPGKREHYDSTPRARDVARRRARPVARQGDALLCDLDADAEPARRLRSRPSPSDGDALTLADDLGLDELRMRALEPHRLGSSPGRRRRRLRGTRAKHRDRAVASAHRRRSRAIEPRAPPPAPWPLSALGRALRRGSSLSPSASATRPAGRFLRGIFAQQPLSARPLGRGARGRRSRILEEVSESHTTRLACARTRGLHPSLTRGRGRASTTPTGASRPLGDRSSR